jgi:hypothetical protein
VAEDAFDFGDGIEACDIQKNNADEVRKQIGERCIEEKDVDNAVSWTREKL